MVQSQVIAIVKPCCSSHPLIRPSLLQRYCDLIRGVASHEGGLSWDSLICYVAGEEDLITGDHCISSINYIYSSILTAQI